MSHRYHTGVRSVNPTGETGGASAKLNLGHIHTGGKKSPQSMVDNGCGPTERRALCSFMLTERELRSRYSEKVK